MPKSSFYIKAVALLWIMLVPPVALSEEPAAHLPSVAVFTAKSLPPLIGVDPEHTVFILDGVENELASMRFAYPGSEEAAKKMALARVNSPAFQASIERIKVSGQALVQAWVMGIEKLPAVLVDDQYVVYGQWDVNAALETIREYRANEMEQ
ncbi:MAG: TIGR03757 family integrating conjugative element protein [Pseudomonadota bacterium]